MKEEIEVETETKTDNEEITKVSPVPKSIIVMIILVAVIGIALITWLLTDNDQKTNAVTALENIEVSEITSLGDPITALMQKDNDQVEYDSLSPSNQELIASIPLIIKSNDELKKLTSILNLSVEILSKDLSSFKIKVDSSLIINDQRMNQIQAKLTDIHKAVDLLKENTLSNEQSIKAIHKISKAKRKKKKSIKKKLIPPSFSLINVQIWDSTPLAIVLYKESPISLRINEVLDGWLIKSISKNGCIDVKKNKQVVSLCQ